MTPQPAADIAAWAIAGVLGGAVGVMGAAASALMLHQVKKMTDSVHEAVQQMDDRVKKRLYDEKGIPFFMTRDECDRRQGECGRQMCNKIDQKTGELSRQLKAMDAEREKSRDQLAGHLEKIHTFIGKVNEFMRNHVHSEK